RMRVVAALATAAVAAGAGTAAALGGSWSGPTVAATPDATWAPPAWFAEQRRERAEYTRTVGGCLEALGWSVTVDVDGTLSALRNSPDDSDPGARLDDLRRCHEENGYPYDAPARELTAEEARTAHAKDVDSWRCWQHEGYDLEAPPPLSEYLSRAGAVGWDALQFSGLSERERAELLATCPLRLVG
ncbi:hypothetical protein, partial [Cellulomonas algicola]